MGIAKEPCLMEIAISNGFILCESPKKRLSFPFERGMLVATRYLLRLFPNGHQRRCVSSVKTQSNPFGAVLARHAGWLVVRSAISRSQTQKNIFFDVCAPFGVGY